MRKQAEGYNWEGVNFPATFHDIDKFERNNKIGVILFGAEQTNYRGKVTKEKVDEIIILRAPREKVKAKKTVQLLLISNGKKKHYCVVKNTSRLLSSQVNNHKEKRYFCTFCLNGFNTEKSLENHLEYCSTNECVKTIFPDGEKIKDFIKFENYQKMHKVPFVVYADFECFLKPIDGVVGKKTTQQSKTDTYQKHEPSGFCFKVKSFDDEKYEKAVRYTKRSEDEDISKIYVEQLAKVVKEIYEKFKVEAEMIFKEEDEKDFENEKECYACGRKFDGYSEYHNKCRDHCHFSGKYRGAAHSRCNLKMKKQNFIPVFFHNLEGYDSHLFIKNLGVSEGNIDCIPKTEEKYISFSKNIEVDNYKDKKGRKICIMREIRFIDSFKFMSASLESLGNN